MPATVAHTVLPSEIIADIQTICDHAQFSTAEATSLNLRLTDSILMAIAEGDENPWLLAQTYVKYMFDDPASEKDIDIEV